METVCVLGLGYVGLPTASILASSGFRVLGVDVDPRVVASLSRGEVHIEEPGLSVLVQAALNSQFLRVAAKPEPADAYVIAVPTPILADKRADLSYVRAAAESILPVLKRGALVILESTSPPGTTREVLCPILSRGGLKAPDDILVAYCPERILPGRVLQELVSNARVIGGLDRRSAERARELYGRFVDGEIHLTDDKTAELVKLFENTYRDVNIALANEFAKMAEAAGCDGHAAIRFANAHPRVDILAPGPGVGGHCIPVDPWFLAERFPGVARLVVAAREVNDGMVEHLAARLSGLGVARGAKVAILGAAYKADIDDARESPSERLAERLAAAGMKVAVHDPLVKRFHLPLSPLEEALAGAEAAVLAVNHAEYRALEPGFLARTMRRPLVLDARRAIDRERFEAAGVRVVTLGVGG